MEALLGYAMDHCNKGKEAYVQAHARMEPHLVSIRGISPFGNISQGGAITAVANTTNVKVLEPLEMRVIPIVHRSENGQRPNPFDAFVTLGSATNNDIVSPNKAVSSAHAFFYKEPNGVYLEGPDTTNGTAVLSPDGSRMPLTPHAKTLLQDGVTLEVGGESTGDRYVFFSDPGSLYDFVTRQKANSTGR